MTHLLIELLFTETSNEVTNTYTWWFDGLLVELIATNVNTDTDVG